MNYTINYRPNLSANISADTKAEAKAIFLRLYHLEESDIISIKPSPENGEQPQNR